MSGSSGGVVPNSNHAAQMLLRTDAEWAIGKDGFLVDNEVYTTGTVGGACSLACAPIGGNMDRLTATGGAGDFFYPCIDTSGGGVGACAVPVGQAEGTIVVTGGMNGCSLQVNRHGGLFADRFRDLLDHDAPRRAVADPCQRATAHGGVPASQHVPQREAADELPGLEAEHPALHDQL